MIIVTMESGERFNLNMSFKEFLTALIEQEDDFGFVRLFDDYAILPRNISSITKEIDD